MPVTAAGPAGAVTPALLEQVRERARIEDLFNPADLRKAGREFLSRCPWHDDRRPSLTVSPARNRVHCFVCGRGTDAIGWLQDRQGLSFQEAVLELAQRCGISPVEGDPQAQQRWEQERRQRRELLARRQRQRLQFQQNLERQLVNGGPAAELLRRRGLSPETARHWQLGFADGRLVIPLNDPAGQCVGFCGRALADELPKYRNSAGDLLFQRNGLVFGLDRAAEAIRREGTALLVEGPLDGIQLHQAGFCQAVACLGTSVSPLQLQLLRRHGLRHLLIAFDGDSAGRSATARLLGQLQPQLLSGELTAAVLQLPEGQDADGLVRSQGPAALEGLIAGAEHWLEWRLARLLEPLDGAEIGRGGASLELLQRIEREGQALLQTLPEGVLRRTAERLLEQGLALRPSGKESQALAGEQPPVALPLVPATTARQRAERRVVRLFIHALDCRDPLLALPITDPACRAALDWACNLAVAVAEEQLPAALLQVAGQLGGSTAALLRQAAAPGEEVVELLRRDPQAELQALMDWLEPLPPSA
ncbi:CHC2 zinc finger domain-containing protein [Vulcanococcus limneticus]|uniref:CHC2 zinc finger domain-containing protein n=1 Tax=Vulcanococcus limneticus TaxID=2170428 RepID=UPI0020CF364E|nr:CHC2 zinc finger domain-containing protein [Vulcanococcus limneticus]MCP9793580.1 toprim domain-containing protein [Vulcanococcus limneticus MW73D5]